jgi:hypothetical protein
MGKKVIMPDSVPYFILGAVFTFLGLVIGIVGICIMTSNIRFAKTAKEVDATITGIETYYEKIGGKREVRHRTYVSYDYGVRRYEDKELGYYSTGMKKGNVITILVDPSDPEQIRGNISPIFYVMLIGMGTIFAVIGLIVLLVAGGKQKEFDNIMQNGVVVRAVVNEIYVPIKGPNKKFHFFVNCTYHDNYTGMDHKFSSEAIYNDSDKNWKQGDTVDVHVLPENFTKYYVDPGSHVQASVY